MATSTSWLNMQKGKTELELYIPSTRQSYSSSLLHSPTPRGASREEAAIIGKAVPKLAAPANCFGIAVDTQVVGSVPTDAMNCSLTFFPCGLLQQ